MDKDFIIIKNSELQSHYTDVKETYSELKEMVHKNNLILGEFQLLLKDISGYLDVVHEKEDDKNMLYNQSKYLLIGFLSGVLATLLLRF